MADTTILGAADLNAATEAAKNYGNVMLDIFKNLINSGGELKEVLAKISGKSFGELEKLITESDISKVMGQATKSLKEFGAKARDTISDLDKFSSSNIGIAVSLAAAAGGINMMGDAFTVMGGKAADASFQVKNIEGYLSKFKGIPGLDKITAPFLNLIKIGEGAKNLENAYLRSAAAGGNLNDVMKAANDNFGRMDNVMQKFYTHVRNVGDATGRSSGEVAEYYNELQKIPGAIDETIMVSRTAAASTGALSTAVQTSKEPFDRLIATMRVADGTMQDMKTVQAAVSTLYRELGESGQESLEMFSLMNETVQNLGMPFDIMQNFTLSAAKDFKYLGDNTESVIGIMNKFAPSLKDFGLGPQAISEVVTNIVQNISKLDMAKKAFLAGQTGGAGGMKGAFQIDLMLHEGKLGEVQKKVEESLKKQMGGKIVSLEEAAKSESAASQMAKQIQILTSGPLKIANDDQQAEAIIQAMAKGSEMPKMETPEQALKKTMDRGQALNTRQITELVSINNKLEYIGNQQAIAAYQLTRATIGTDKSKMNAVEPNDIKQGMEDVLRQATSKESVAGRGRPAGVSELNVNKSITDMSDMVRGIISGESKTNKTAEEAKKQKELENRLSNQFSRTASPEETVTTTVAKAGREESGGAGTGGGRARRTGEPKESQTYNIDVVCSDCGKSRFKAKFDALEAEVARMETTSADNQRGL